MANDDKNKIKDAPYPEGFEHVRDIAAPYRDDIWRINAQIQNLPPERKEQANLSPHYTPPGFVKPRPSPQTMQRQQLEYARDAKEAELYKRIDIEMTGVKDFDPELAQQVKDSVRDDVHRNPYEDMTPHQLALEKPKSREIENSQQYMRTLLRDANEKEEKATNQPSPEQEKAEASPESTERSASERFNSRLSYTRAVENAKDITEKADPAPPKESKDISKE